MSYRLCVALSSNSRETSTLFPQAIIGLEASAISWMIHTLWKYGRVKKRYSAAQNSGTLAALIRSGLPTSQFPSLSRLTYRLHRYLLDKIQGKVTVLIEIANITNYTGSPVVDPGDTVNLMVAL